MKNLIKQEIINLEKEIINSRRYLHQHPELSFNEKNTSKFIISKLNENNIEYDNTLSDTSVIGKIKINDSNNWIALRADIDALAIKEEFESEYQSQNESIMHACGHDSHTAILLGVAIFLKKNVKLLKQNILLIFQSGEEKNPGGAKILINNGLLKKYNIKKIIAQHADPDVSTGSFAFGKGNIMASCDELYIDFIGIGGHAAMPDKRSETVLAASHFIYETMLLQKQLNYSSPIIITFGKIIANGAVNIIPANVRLEGTLRTYDKNLRSLAKKTLIDNANNLAKQYKSSCNFIISEGYPNLHNNNILYKEIINIAKEFLPKNNILKFKKRMSSEDFAWYSQKIPALLYRFGVKGNGFGNYPLHNSKFNIDEKAIISATEFLSFLAINL